MKITVKKANPNKLQTELINEGIIPILFENDRVDSDEYIANNVWITFDNGVNLGLVQQIIDNHSPMPLPLPISELDKVKLAQAEQFEYTLQTLEGMM